MCCWQVARRLSGPSPEGGQWWPSPHLKSVPPFSSLYPWLLHISNTVFLKWGPHSGLCSPQLLNPGDGPGPCHKKTEACSQRVCLTGNAIHFDVDKYTVVRRAFSERIHFHHRHALCSYLSTNAKCEKLTEGKSTTCFWNLCLDRLIQKLAYETELHPAVK